MGIYEPITLAFPLAKRLTEFIVAHMSLPSEDEVKNILKELGLEELYSGRGLSLFRNRELVVIAFPRENLVIDIIPATGAVGDALEVVVYKDRKLNAIILEVLPANDIEYEGNIGLEPAIVNLESGELESTPVFGDFDEEMHLVIDRRTYERWRESGKLDTCPICGGELAWEGKKAYCQDCGYGVRIKE